MPENQDLKNQKDICPLCFSKSFQDWILHEEKDSLVECTNCGCGYLNPYPDLDEDLYENYGDYITALPKHYFKNRIKVSSAKYLFFKVLNLFVGKSKRILDYGGGAGFFVHSARAMGFKKSYVYDPSNNFRLAAIEKVGLPEEFVKSSISDMTFKFDFVSMLDVIEHLPEDKIHDLIIQLKTIMNPGGLLFGETPNKNSLNIKLFGEKDPVITPPSHLIYFTYKSLDQLLVSHGFKRKILFTKGISTNSFFRKEKFVPSFIEMPSGKKQKIISIITKLIFSTISIPFSLFGFGYQIVFVYKLAHDG